MPTGCGLLIHRMARGNTLKRGAVGALVSLAVAAVLASSDEHTRAVVLFLSNGLFTVTAPSMAAILLRRFPKITPRCGSDFPMAARAWDALEASLLRAPPTPPRPVREIDWSDPEAACAQTLLDRDLQHEPFIIRGAAPLSAGVGSAKQIMWDSSWLGNLKVIDMEAFSANFSRIAACPYERKSFHREADAEEVLRGAHPALYAAFDTNFLERNRNAFVEVNASMSALAQMCGTFRGFLGEAFFGFGAAADAPYTVGSALHAAAMPNLFLQVHGEREWTLVDPSWLQYLRPTLGTSYVAALGAYSDWATLARPPHYDRIPTLTTTTRPGDVLYIPPWFLHEVVLARPGEFSFGISNRGALAHDQQSWRRWPVLRYVPWINGGAWSANRLALDLVSTLAATATTLVSAPLISIEQSQHGSDTP